MRCSVGSRRSSSSCTRPAGRRRNVDEPTETRAEALQWCKDRALEYVDAGELQQAFTSFASDVRKHPGTLPLSHTITRLWMPLLVAGGLDTPKAMREWINGF